MAIKINYLDPEGDGTEYKTPYPSAERGTTVYNGSKGCNDCGILMGPVNALNSDICPGCSRRKAAKHVANRMV